MYCCTGRDKNMEQDDPENPYRSIKQFNSLGQKMFTNKDNEMVEHKEDFQINQQQVNKNNNESIGGAFYETVNYTTNTVVGGTQLIVEKTLTAPLLVKDYVFQEDEDEEAQKIKIEYKSKMLNFLSIKLQCRENKFPSCISNDDYQILEYCLEERQNPSEWKLQLDKQELKLWLKKDSLFKDGICFQKIYQEYNYDGYGDILNDMIQLFYDPQKRKEWDTSLNEFQIVKQISPEECEYYQSYYVPFPFKDRWFYEKRVMFFSEKLGEHVTFYGGQATPDQQFHFDQSGTRSKSIIGVILIKNNQIKKKIEIWIFSQCDQNSSIPSYIYESAMPISIEKQYNLIKDAFNKTIEKNKQIVNVSGQSIYLKKVETKSLIEPRRKKS